MASVSSRSPFMSLEKYTHKQIVTKVHTVRRQEVKKKEFAEIKKKKWDTTIVKHKKNKKHQKKRDNPHL